MYINGTNVANSSYTSSNISVHPWLIFTRNDSTVEAACKTEYIDSIKIWEDYKLVKDFTPSTYNNKPCFCENISGKLYYPSSNNGWVLDSSKARQTKNMYIGKKIYKDFPDDYTLLEYIEGTGTQYIDTGIKMGYDVRLDATFQYTNIATTTNGWVAAANETVDGTTYRYYPLQLSGKTSFRSAQADNSNIFTVTSDTNKHTIQFNTNPTYSSGHRIIYDGTQKGTLTSFPGYSSFTKNIYLFAMNSNGNAIEINQGMRLYECLIYQNSSSRKARWFVPALDPSGRTCLYDVMQKKAYYSLGTEDFVASPRLSNAVARKVFRAFIGDSSGVARIFYPKGWQQSKFISDCGGAAYILNKAGESQLYVCNYNADMTANYNSSFVKQTTASFSESRSGYGKASLPNYAVYAGGRNDSDTLVKTTDVFTKTGTRATTQQIGAARENWLGAANSSYAFFTMGANEDTSTVWKDTYAIKNSDGTKTTATALTSFRSGAATLSTNNFAIFAGGATYNSSGDQSSLFNSVEYYTTSNSKKTLSSSLHASCIDLLPLRVNNYALFIGGDKGELDGDFYQATVYSISSSSAMTKSTTLTFPSNLLYHEGVAGHCGNGDSIGCSSNTEGILIDQVSERVPPYTRYILAIDSNLTYTISRSPKRYDLDDQISFNNHFVKTYDKTLLEYTKII